MNFTIQNYFFLISGLVLLLAQSCWFFYNKKHPNKWQEWGISKKIQDTLWIFFGVLFITGMVLIILSFDNFVIGIVASLILCVAILPLFWGLIL